MLGWLQSIFRHAAAIGRFWYSVARNRGSVNLAFDDSSHATVTRTDVRVERAVEDTMAGLFAARYVKAEGARVKLIGKDPDGHLGLTTSDAATLDTDRQHMAADAETSPDGNGHLPDP